MQSSVEQLSSILDIGRPGAVLVLIVLAALVLIAGGVTLSWLSRDRKNAQTGVDDLTGEPSKPKGGAGDAFTTSKPQPPYTPEDADLTTPDDAQDQDASSDKQDTSFSSGSWVTASPSQVDNADFAHATGVASAPPPLAPDDAEYDVRRIFFGTDRKQTARTDTITGFGYERSGALTLGIAHITVPHDRPWGKIQRPRRIPFLGITIEREKASKHFTIADCRPVDPTEFASIAGAEAHAAERFANAAFIFVHGFNVPFDAALFRCAQMAEDIRFDGPAFLYSWPAIGGGIKGTINYVTDIESADQAARHLDAFVDLVLQTPSVDRVHMIAHSMGNKLLAKWVDKAGTRLRARNTKTIDQLILAAPDIDVGTLRDVSDHLQRFANGVTLFACATDLALIASKKLRNDYPRAGDVPAKSGPVIIAGIDTIDISAVGNRFTSLQKYLGDDSFLDHSLFAEDREILSDLGNLMRAGTRPPDARTVSYKKRGDDGATYWVLPG